MKFKLLSIGQKFKFQDEIYIKTSPIVASNIETGHNKMIPRYTVLTLLDHSGNDTQTAAKEAIPTQDVLNAFNLLYEKCIVTLEENNVLVPIIKNKLDKARDEFTQYLIQKN